MPDVVQHADGDDIVAGMQGSFDVESRLCRPVGGFADALVVDKNPAMVVNAAETHLHGRIVQIVFAQLDVCAVNRRLAFGQKHVAGVAVGLGLD